MEIWHLWIAALASSMAFVTSHFGVSQAAAIIWVTLLLRAALMPVSLAASLRMQSNREKLRRIEPEIAVLRQRLEDDPSALAAATLRLHRQHGIRMFDSLALSNMGSQAIVGLGIFQAIGKAGLTSRFLWIANLSRPDVLLTALVAALMLIGMAMAPGAFAEPSTIVMLGIALVVAVVAVSAMPAAVGIYWATSNGLTIVQAGLLRVLIRRRRVPIGRA